MTRSLARLALAAALAAGAVIPQRAPAQGTVRAPASAPPRATTAAPASRTKLVMLGTGTPAADPDRFGSAVVVLVDSTPYLFDAGVGVVRRWAGALRGGVAAIGPATLHTVFITHLHSDHTLGLPELILTTWTLGGDTRPPLEAYGPPGLGAMTTHILAAWAEDIAIRTGPAGEGAGEAPPVVHVHEIEPGVVYHDSLVTVTAFTVHHGAVPHAFGYRIQTPDKVIVLSGDAGPPSTVADQCRGCDVLVHEGGGLLAADATEYFRRFHTTVEGLAEIANAARPKLLVLYHQRAPSPIAERSYARLRQLYAGPFVVARDLDVYR